MYIYTYISTADTLKRDTRFYYNKRQLFFIKPCIYHFMYISNNKLKPNNLKK